MIFCFKIYNQVSVHILNPSEIFHTGVDEEIAVTVVVEMPLVMMIHSLSVIVEYIALYIYISLISRSVIKISP